MNAQVDADRDRLGLVLGAATVLVFVVVVEIAGTYAFHTQPAARTLCQILIGGLLALWAACALVRPALRPRSALAGPIALAMVAFGLSVLGSERPRLSLEPALIGVASALTLLMFTSLLRVPTVRRLVAATVLLLGAGIAIAYVVQVGLEWIRWWGLVGRFTAPPLRPSFASLSFGSPNLVATFLLLLGPLAAVIASQRFGRRAGAALLAIAVVALVLTGSRGGYLGLAAAAGLGVLLILPFAVRRIRTIAAGIGAKWLVGAGAATAIVAAVGAILLGPGLLSRLTLSGSDLRGWYWRSATELFERAPLTGTGPGTWAQLKLGETLPHEVNFSVPHAHSLWFQTISEVGALGAAALALFAVVFLWRCLAVACRRDGWTRLQVGAVLVGLAGLVGQQIPDYLMNLPAVALVAGLLIAWVDGADAEAGGMRVPTVAHVSSRLAVPAALVLGGVLAAAFPTLLTLDRAMWVAYDADLAAAGGDWDTALAGYDDAVAADPDFTLYRLERANALAHLGRLEEARDAYGPAIEEDLLPEHILGLAGIELELGNEPRAAELAEVALARGWRNPTVTLNAGRMFEAAGDRARAIQAYAVAIYADPALASSAYWEAEDRRVSRDDAVSAAREAILAVGDVGTAATVAAYAGRMDEASADVATIADEATRRWYTAVMEGIGGSRQGGIDSLRAIVDASPGDFTSTAWLARFLRDAGDPAAETYIDRAMLMRADETPALVVEYSVVPAIESERPLGAWTSYPFAVYSRLGPPDLWPPQLLVIGVTEPS